MKKYSLIKAAALFLVVMFISASLLQCTKEGNIIDNLDRTFYGSPDSTIYVTFYDSNKVSYSDVIPDVNDYIVFRGVKTILKEYCGTSNCHGGPIAPKFNTYNEVMKYVSAGSPDKSELWMYLTTNDFNKAMPPVNSNLEMIVSDKNIIYNWIVNGAKERPDLNDFRPAAISLINNGCGSANCHNQATATGGWARKGLLGPLTTSDTTTFIFINPQTGAQTTYCQVSNVALRNQVWGSYKDSVKKFYGNSLDDTLLNPSFRPWKTLTTPRSSQSVRGPLQDYDDILMDIKYPKSARSNTSVQYIDPVTGIIYYARGNFLNVTSSMVSRCDSTVLLANPYTGIYATNQQGDMAYGDGGLKPGEIGLIKAWYFADPNIPDVWKFGQNNAGILKYRKTGYIIKK